MSKIIVETTFITKLNRPKTVHIYLPTGYDGSTRFPVLYMHDGHNLFDASTSAFGTIWNVHQSLDKIEQETGMNLIVVGIDCPSPKRFDEYSPWINHEMREYKSYLQQDSAGGEGEQYIDWLVRELKPSIDRRYCTNPNLTYLAGSSMGGLISLYAGYRYPDVFHKIGVFSPAVWFAKQSLLDYLDQSFDNRLGVYLDIGTAETSNASVTGFPKIYLTGARAVRDLLQKKGIRDLLYVEAEGEVHSEAAWAKRFPNFAQWILKESTK